MGFRVYEDSCRPPVSRITFTSASLVKGLRFRVWSSGFSVQDLEFRVQCSGFGVQGSMFRDWSSGFRVQSSGFRAKVQGLGFRVFRGTSLMEKHPPS